MPIYAAVLKQHLLELAVLARVKVVTGYIVTSAKEYIILE